MLSDEPASQEIMSTSSAFLVLALLIITFSSSTLAASSQPQQQHEHSMSGVSQEKHNEQVNKQGDMAMGFSHAKATHHFRLTAAGGFIEVQTKDPKDSTSREQIRRHLRHVSKLFKAGDFSAPEMTHGRVPPGIPTMTRLKGNIEYKYEETKSGGKVLISTTNTEALNAIHDFLRFQIEDHRTGDPTSVRKP